MAKAQIKTYEITIAARKDQPERVITAKGYYMIVNGRGDLILGAYRNDTYASDQKAMACFRTGSWLSAREITEETV